MGSCFDFDFRFHFFSTFDAEGLVDFLTTFFRVGACVALVSPSFSEGGDSGSGTSPAGCQVSSVGRSVLVEPFRTAASVER
jgi:hypothetical protein